MLQAGRRAKFMFPQPVHIQSSAVNFPGGPCGATCTRGRAAPGPGDTPAPGAAAAGGG
jgi:hypothetical protein